MLTRRELLRLGLLGSASLLLNSKSLKAQVGVSPPVTPFARPLPIPGLLSPISSDATTDFYQITMRTAQVEIIPGLQTTVWGYNGLYPGPVINARSGRRVVVRQTNNLPENASVHLHGGHIAADSDGHPTDVIAPGAFKDYTYSNNQLPATLWYHDHLMDVTGRHVYMGLAGFYIISDEYEDALPLPKGRFDIPIVIQDRLFNADGSLNYNTGGMMNPGFTGDRILVNGAVQPFYLAERRKIRFRILNGSNSRIYNLALSSGQSIIQIGSDGGLLSAPVSRTSITLAPAERADVVIDFAVNPIGSQVILKNLNGSGSVGDIMRFDVVPKRGGKWGVDNASIPAMLRQVDRIPPSSASVSRTILLTAGMNGGVMRFTFNGLPFNPSRIDATPSLDATEIWTFSNQTGMPHPIHIHDIQWQILAIDGQPPSAADSGWKDTFLVPANGDASVIGKFTDYRGIYVFHCHNLEHEDNSMMGQFQVV